MSVFEDLKESLDLTAGAAHVALNRLVTVDGKVPFQLAMRRLLVHEQSLVQELIGREDVRLVPMASEEYESCNVIVAYSRMGKLSLYIKGLETPDEEAELLAGLQVEPAILDRVRGVWTQDRLLEERERALNDAVLLQWEADGVLAKRVMEAADWVDHVETVYLHVDRRVFARSDVGNNLLRDRYLEKLKDKPVAEWMSCERLFVFAIHALFRTGRSIRFEEFNGLEVTARELRRWMEEKLCLYSQAVGYQVGPAELQLPTLEMATRVGELLEEVDRSGWVRMRQINGISITKEEQLVAPDDAEGREVVELPQLLVEYGQQLGLDLHPLVDPEMSMEELTMAALRRDMELGTSLHVEEIIQRTVLSAVLETGSDYAMSSSIRDFARLQGTPESRAAGALSLNKPDFFTCVINHPEKTKRIPDIGMANILHMVAARMEFNRWHFVVGNFERDEIPQNRHYYFPPSMPDIAEWSDVWHGGHAHASVRYTVRAPGAQLWKDPFLAFGHPYRGIYDIRLVRMQGPGFTKEEMFTASRHTALLDAFWRTMMSQIESGAAVPAIAAFTKDWYLTDMKWKDVLIGCGLMEPTHA